MTPTEASDPPGPATSPGRTETATATASAASTTNATDAARTATTATPGGRPPGTVAGNASFRAEGVPPRAATTAPGLGLVLGTVSLLAVAALFGRRR